MTTIGQTPRTGPVTANGVTTEFTFTFRVIDEDEVVVVLTDTAGADTIATLTEDYTVTDVGEEGGGYVTMLVAPTLDHLVTIYRDTAMTQSVDLRSRKALVPSGLEAAYDKLTRIAQEQDDKLGRSAQLPPSSTRTGLTLPEPQVGIILQGTATGWENGLDAASFAADLAAAEAAAIALSGDAAAADISATAALASQNAAAGSETNAATSETNAANSEAGVAADALAAATSETNAAASALAASNSEAAAAISETNAGGSETTASAAAAASSGDAAAAAISAAAALASQNAAAGSALAADTSETNAAASALAAGTSETNAAASEANAADSETNASASATNASGSAVSATTSKNAAAASALAASNSEAGVAADASAAGTSETNAAASAGAASTSETNAAASAGAASGSAAAAAALFVNPSITGTWIEDVYAMSGTTVALEPDNGSIQTHTLTGNTTYTDAFTAGQAITLMIYDGTSRTVTWPTITWVNNGGLAPALAPIYATVVVLWKIGSQLYGSFVGDGS